MGHPRPVEAGLRLAFLVLAHLRERRLVDRRVLAGRDERRHPAHREGPPLVAGLHQQVGVRLHHRRPHGDRAAVGQGEALGVAEVLDDAEQVVPPAGVQPGGVVAELPEDLLHLEGRRDGLDQHGRADRALRQAELVLGVAEHVVPEPRLEVRLHLRQVEVRAAAPRELLGGVVEEVQAEVDERADQRLAVERQVGLVEVPAPRPRQDHRQVVGVLQLVALALRRGEGDRAPDRVGEVDLALHDVAPVRGVGVLEVGQPHAGAGVQRVDGHLAAGRAGDLDPAVLQVPRGRRHLPVGAADLRGGRPGTPAARRPRSAPGGYAARRAARRGGRRTAAAGPRRTPAPPASAPPRSGRRPVRTPRCSSSAQRIQPVRRRRPAPARTPGRRPRSRSPSPTTT